LPFNCSGKKGNRLQIRTFSVSDGSAKVPAESFDNQDMTGIFSMTGLELKKLISTACLWDVTRNRKIETD